MVTSNKDAKRIWQEIEKVKNTKQTESVDPHYEQCNSNMKQQAIM